MSEKQKISIYALSTCVHCRQAKEYIEEKGYPIESILVDKLQGEERAAAVAKVREMNPRLSFPIICFDDGACVVVGFEKEKIDKALKK